MTTYSETCAQWLTAVRYEELPDDVIAMTKLRMLDAIGLVLAAGPTPLGRSAREAALAMGGGTGARLLGFGDRATPMCAALANGTLAQALDCSDTEEARTTETCNANVVAALALGEAVGVSGREAITVVAAAIELSARIGLAAATAFDNLGLVSTGIRSTLSVAYGASRLLGLDILPMCNAVGIAGTQAAGALAGGDIGQAKCIHAGWCALSGIAAALLAQADCTGPNAVFEGCVDLGRRAKQRSGRLELRRLTAGLGSTWESRTLEQRAGASRAHETDDALAADALRVRFRENAACMLKPGQVEAIIERLDALEQARSLQPLIELCVARER